MVLRKTEFESWVSDFKPQNRMFQGKILNLFELFGHKIQELVNYYMLPTGFVMKYETMANLIITELRKEFTLQIEGKKFEAALENIPKVSISMLTTKVLKAKAVFQHSHEVRKDAYLVEDIKFVQTS